MALHINGMYSKASDFTSGEVTPDSAVVPCSSSEDRITVSSTNQTSTYKHLGVFVTPGSSLTVSKNYSTTISNSATFSIVPQLVNMGYSKSITAGYNIGWSKTNNTSSTKELVIVKVYDVIKVVKYTSYSDGYCTVGSTNTYNVAKGWAFDLR